MLVLNFIFLFSHRTVEWKLTGAQSRPLRRIIVVIVLDGWAKTHAEQHAKAISVCLCVERIKKKLKYVPLYFGKP